MMKKILNFLKPFIDLLIKIYFSMTTNSQGQVLDLNKYFEEINADPKSLALEGGLRRRSGKIKKRKLEKLATEDEIVDTAGDTYQIGYVIVRALQDGFQLTDIITFIGQQEGFTEIVNDFPIFWEALQKHKIENSEELIQKIVANIRGRLIEIKGVGVTILNGLWYAASSAEFIADVLAKAKLQIDMAGQIASGELMVPPLEDVA
jgi:hypothetical protein